MKMITNSKLFVVITFCFGLLSASVAQATTYTVQEIFSGSWTAIWGSPTSFFTHTATLQTLILGDSSLFSESVSTSEVIDNVTTCASCTSTEYLKNGDQIFATTSVAFGGGLVPNKTTLGLVDNLYIGTITITGGTGLFEGATGSGSYRAIDYGVMNSDANGNFISFNPSGQWTFDQTVTINTAPVPEPETYAMMLSGLVLIGFATRRRNDKQSQFSIVLLAETK